MIWLLWYLAASTVVTVLIVAFFIGAHGGIRK